MSSISHEPSRASAERRAAWSPQVFVPEMWASLAIIVMWLCVLFGALFGPDIVTVTVAGDRTTVPSAVAVAFFAFLGTLVVARHGFRPGPKE
jgi:hypothetical protein